MTVQRMRNELSFEEKIADKSVQQSQAFEFTIMLIVLNELVKVFENDTPRQRAESLNYIRKQTKKETDIFLPILLGYTLETLKLSHKQVSKEFESFEGFEHIVVPPPNNKWHKEIEKEFEKYIKSKGFVIGGQSLEAFFNNVCNEQVKKIVEGSTTLKQAVKDSCHIMAKNGVSIVTYPQPNGHAIHRNIDVYVRQQLLYAQKESTQDTRFKIAEEMGITTFEIDAHPDARPTHQKWQGMRFDTTGKLYPTFEELSDGNGSLDDYGCLHRTYAVDPTSEPAYTLSELRNINTKPFEFNGTKYTGYQAKQKMRYYERGIRGLEKEKYLLENVGISSSEIKVKIRAKRKVYEQFAEAYGTYPRFDRTKYNVKK